MGVKAKLRNDAEGDNVRAGQGGDKGRDDGHDDVAEDAEVDVREPICGDGGHVRGGTLVPHSHEAASVCESSHTHMSQRQNHSQIRRMQQYEAPVYGEFIRDFDLDSHEWGCSDQL